MNPITAHVTVNGVRSPLIDEGPRSSEAVVFVHGGSTNARSVDRTVYTELSAFPQ